MATLASAGTTLLSLSFAFSVTCQEFLGSCIFLFVKHPYDVGDRVDISDEQLIVEKISLLYTVFTRINTMKVVQVCHNNPLQITQHMLTYCFADTQHCNQQPLD